MAAPPDPIEIRIERMSAEERIGQLLFVGFTGKELGPELATLVGKQRVGGLILYAENLQSVDQIRKLTGAIRQAGDANPPFIAIDQEGGVVRRLPSGVPLLPSNMALAATRSPELAQRAGASIGRALRNLGVTMNLAPVLDVLPVGETGALETRSFGDDPALAATLGIAFIEGQRQAGVISAAKHFPGQGAAQEDTHRQLPILDLSRRQMEERDLIPFRRAIEKGLEAVVTGHVALPQLTEKRELPATLSSAVMTKLLRDDLHFEGIVISDALQMEAVANGEGPGALAVRALLAGCDMVLALGGKAQRDEVHAALLRAHRDGTLSDARLRQSLRRILKLKARLAAPQPQLSIKGNIERDLAQRSITLLGEKKLLAEVLSQPFVFVGATGIVQQSLKATVEDLSKAKGWIAVAQTDEQWQHIRKLSASFPELPMIYVNLGSPYRDVDSRKCVTILTYSSSPASQQAAADVIHGYREAVGVLPVRLPSP